MNRAEIKVVFTVRTRQPKTTNWPCDRRHVSSVRWNVNPQLWFLLPNCETNGFTRVWFQVQRPQWNDKANTPSHFVPAG